MPSRLYRKGGHRVSYKIKGGKPVGKCYQERARQITRNECDPTKGAMARDLWNGSKLNT